MFKELASNEEISFRQNVPNVKREKEEVVFSFKYSKKHSNLVKNRFLVSITKNTNLCKFALINTF